MDIRRPGASQVGAWARPAGPLNKAVSGPRGLPPPLSQVGIRGVQAGLGPEEMVTHWKGKSLSAPCCFLVLFPAGPSGAEGLREPGFPALSPVSQLSKEASGEALATQSTCCGLLLRGPGPSLPRPPHHLCCLAGAEHVFPGFLEDPRPSTFDPASSLPGPGPAGRLSQLPRVVPSGRPWAPLCSAGQRALGSSLGVTAWAWWYGPHRPSTALAPACGSSWGWAGT